MTTLDTKTSMNSLAKFWHAFNTLEAPYVHPLDRDLVLKQPHRLYSSTETYIASEDFGSPGSLLQLGLLPVPYAGDLGKADIFVLLLNPGFDTVDLYGEADEPAFHNATLQMIKQDQSDEDFPFMFLNPKFCWSGGYRWWEKKVRDVTAKISEKKEISYLDALKVMSQHLAAVELIPYHSATRPGGSLEKLPSAMAAKAFVRDELLPKAQRGELTLIVTRQVLNWGILPADVQGDVVVYDAGHARGASLSTASSGGRAVLRRILS